MRGAPFFHATFLMMACFNLIGPALGLPFVTVRQLESNRRTRTGGPHQLQLEPNRRAASAAVKLEARISWNQTGGLRQLQSNRRAASAAVKLEARISWSQT